ncbi:MAG TPA: T9SS type A sorting domain-containing protein, partial [Candidatus Edwardsbacteria bacterium]|nr:T9SS type A sorting domain-containing protein [Candidatus Edwardsbacteria bacterium]
IDNAGQWGPCDSATFYKAAPYVEPSGAFLPDNLVYVWPNPARGGQVHFHYYVNANAAVTADVFSLDGRRIVHLTGRGEGGRPPHQASSNAIVWDIGGVASDVYLLRLSATSDASGEQRTVTKKFAIVK